MSIENLTIVSPGGSPIRYDQWRDPSTARVIAGRRRNGEPILRTLFPGEVVYPGQPVFIVEKRQ